MEPQLSQSHVTLVLSSAYTECAARLPHLTIIRNQLLPHLMVHHLCVIVVVCCNFRCNPLRAFCLN